MAFDTIPHRMATAGAAPAPKADADPDTLLTRRQAASALTAAGYPTAPATLARKASVGGGPVYRRYCSRVVYRWCDLIDWAQSRLSPPVASTSELDRLREPVLSTRAEP